MSQQRPPPQPRSVLRGHRAQVHVTAFIRQNRRLASGDADGFVVLWDLTIMRPRAVWRAHASAILGIAGWGDDRVITEGRDNRLIVWKIAEADETALSTALPLDGESASAERSQPWILHILEINTMNFCSFASCAASPDHDSASEELFIAVPNTLATEAVDIYQLPSQNRQHTVHLGSKTEKKGMVMALALFWLHGSLVLTAAYENGLAMVAKRRRSGSWDIVYSAQAHSQPVLSLDVSPTREYFLTSGADAVIAKHPIFTLRDTHTITKMQAPSITSSSTDVRADTESMPEPKSSAESEANLGQEQLSTPPDHDSNNPASLSQPATSGHPKRTAVETRPLKTISTKHAGQQGLRIRDDGQVFATAGWDAKVRVYSSRTLAELAVLKWHGVGCYAVAFAAVRGDRRGYPKTTSEEETDGQEGREDEGSSIGGFQDKKGSAAVSAALKLGELSVKDRRIKMAKEVHWLAAGSKDGKISLWDIY